MKESCEPVFWYPWLSYSQMIIRWLRIAAPMDGPMPMSCPPSPVTMMKVIFSSFGISPRLLRSSNISTTPERVAAPFWKRLWM